jgi:putative NADH-flavin reductase
VNIAILGSTGKVGTHLVEQALDRGWGVIAFARTPEKLGDLRERVTVIEGDVRDADAVDRAVRNADAVVSAVGHTESSADDVLEVTARHVVDSMREHGVKRFVTLVGAGVESGEDKGSLSRWVVRSAMKLFVGTMLEDAQRHSDLIGESDLDWTVVRPPRLNDDDPTGETRAGYLDLGFSDQCTRADLATFMLDSVESDRWVGELPMVANQR